MASPLAVLSPLLLLWFAGDVEACHFLQIQTSLPNRLLSKPRDFQLSGFRDDRPTWQYFGPMGLDKAFVMWQSGTWVIYGAKGLGAIAESHALGPHNTTSLQWKVFDEHGNSEADPDFKVSCPKPFSLDSLDPMIVEGMDENLKKTIQDPKLHAQYVDMAVYLELLEEPAAPMPSNLTGVYVRVPCTIAEICLTLRDTVLAFDDTAKAWVLARGEYILATAQMEKDDDLAGTSVKLADRGDILTWRPKYNESEEGAVEPPPFTARFLRPAAFEASCDEACTKRIEKQCKDYGYIKEESKLLCWHQRGHPGVRKATDAPATTAPAEGGGSREEL